MKRTLVFLFIVISIIALGETYLRNPLDIPLEITGYFGEYRQYKSQDNPAHFHKGMDLSTAGKTGAEVLSPANSYVASLVVNDPVYGTRLTLVLPGVRDYFNNENGIKVIFAHLESVGDLTTEAGRKLNVIYRKLLSEFSTNYVEARFHPDEIAFKTGDTVAYSGDTGGVAPHLHVEIRDISEKVLLNPGLYFNFPKKSTEIQIIAIKAGGKEYKFDGKTVEMTSYSPLAVRARVLSRHYISPKKISLWIEGKLVYQIDFENYFFIDETTKVNEVYMNSTPSDYWFKLRSSENLSMITVNNWNEEDLSSPKTAKIVVEDHWGNTLEKTFNIVMRR
ncbi:MAG: M23 family metallopeptidase [Kosmotoga sp.]|uniref:M23 family metallopeptidase n=1 Tax=Kosmotoga sp. TaxID=1955248 RepID=UPI001D799424|nr:M23 family metallopeptidase [Kosmotoga sp.]MBO8166142.1 M23 family metallopeptidase [Kosmotoga sp.]